MFVREWLRNCAPVPQSPPPAAAQTCYWGAQRQQSTHTAPTPPPAFWGGQHKVIPGWCNCAFQNPTQTATAISFPSKIPPKETWPSILHSKSLPKSHGHHFPMQQCKAKPIPFNKQAVATFIGLLGNAVLNIFLLTVFLLLRFSGLATNTAFYFLRWNCAAKTWNTTTCLQKKRDISLAPY